MRCGVAVMHRGEHIRCGASVVAPTLERARHNYNDGSGCVATLYGALRGAACGPLPAGRCIAHSPTSSFTHTRDVFHAVAHALRFRSRPEFSGSRLPYAARVLALIA